MKIQYAYSFDDYEAINTARRQHRRFAKLRDIALWLLILFNLVIGMVFVWWMVFGTMAFRWLNLANLGIGLLLLIGIYVGGPLYRRWYLRQQMVEGKIVNLEFDEAGISSDLENNSTTTAWAGIHQADELRTHFVVWINKLQAYSIPKNAFQTQEDLEQFKALLGAKVGNRKF